MKIQCSCGAKYVIDVTPGMPPVQFTCPQCGRDYSAFINDLIRKETEAAASAGAPTAPPAVSTPPPPTPGGTPLKISRSTVSPAPAGETSSAMICVKHHEPAGERCFVCQKPICPKCMELFGYFCSPFCKGKAEAQTRTAPAYAGQAFTKEANYWRKVGRILTGLAVLAVLILGVWIWYDWIGSVPHVALSVRFDDKSHSGGSCVTNDQIIFLHGGTLARYDLKTGKPAWSLELVTKEQVADLMKQEDAAQAQWEQQAGRSDERRELPATREKNLRLGLEEALSLHVSGQNIWVDRENQLTHYDWATGKVLQQIALTNGFGEFIEHGDEFVLLETADNGMPSITRISMATGEQRTESLSGLSAAATLAQNGATSPAGTKDTGGGLPLTPNGDPSRPLDPQKVSEDASHLNLQARIALPAIVAGNLHQQRIFKEIDDGEAADTKKPGARPVVPAENVALVPDGDGFLQFGSKLLEEHVVERSAMKAPPKKSALDNANLNATQTGDVANEVLNDIQRENGGGTVTEDQSRYQVTVRKPGATDAGWTGEVIGAPRLFPLESVNVIAGGQSIVVLDKSNKKIWQADLQHDIKDAGEGSRYGAGPCVEHDGTLFVFDEAVLSAFDVATGNARWRLPSVGIVGLFFGDRDMLYVNTTSGSLDDIKYSQQIDVNKSTRNVFQKIDAKSGKILWSMNPRGLVGYVSGKFIYTFYTFDPGDEEDLQSDALSGLMKPPLTVITRIDPGDGRVLWDHEEGRATMDAAFSGNTIQLIMKKEVEVLRYFTF